MAGKQKHSPLGKELIAGMKEAVAYARFALVAAGHAGEIVASQRGAGHNLQNLKIYSVFLIIVNK